MKIQSWAATDCGRKRLINQDRFQIENDLGLFIIADGMGGHMGGEIAAEMAVQTIVENVRLFKGQMENPQLLRFSFEEANRKIFNHAQKNAELLGMGTTLLVILKDQNEIYFANVGDSRCYLYQNGFLWLMTEDHSLLNEHIRQGILTIEQARKSKKKNVITRSVGYLDNIQVDLYQRTLQPNDEFLLCSDGLYGMVNDELICQIIKNENNQNVVTECISQALKNGGDDNVTVMYLKVS